MNESLLSLPITNVPLTGTGAIYRDLDLLMNTLLKIKTFQTLYNLFGF